MLECYNFVCQVKHNKNRKRSTPYDVWNPAPPVQNGERFFKYPALLNPRTAANGRFQQYTDVPPGERPAVNSPLRSGFSAFGAAATAAAGFSLADIIDQTDNHKNKSPGDQDSDCDISRILLYKFHFFPLQYNVSQSILFCQAKLADSNKIFSKIRNIPKIPDFCLAV
jgi:hypothetical protein